MDTGSLAFDARASSHQGQASSSSGHINHEQQTLLSRVSPNAHSTPSRLNATLGTLKEVSQFKPSLGATLSGLGLMADMYDLVAMNVALQLLVKVYGPATPAQDAMMTSSVLVGSVLGQLGFGALADHIGRRKLTLLVSGLTLVGSLGTALAVPLNQKSPSSIYYSITLMRLLLGLGIGGEYPLSASNTVEQTDTKQSSTAIAYAMLILNSGNVVAGAVFSAILATSPDTDDLNWRLGLGCGAALSAITLALRTMLLEESPAFLAQDDLRTPRNGPVTDCETQEPLLAITPSATPTTSRIQHIKEQLSSPWLKPVFGAAATWFLYDVSTFGLGLYSSEILADKGDAKSATHSLFMSNALAIPFSLFAMFSINDRILGRQNSQTLGLTGMACALGLMAASKNFLWTPVKGENGIQFDSAAHQLIFTALFAAYNCFDAIGPGVSTFAFSSEIFPTRLRGTLSGIASAAGKAGGVVGTMAFPFLKKTLGTQQSILLMSAVCAFGAMLTKLLLPNYTNEHLDRLEKASQTCDKKAVQMLYTQND